MATYSEDALFKALLKNKPPQQPKPAVPAQKKEIPVPVPEVKQVETVRKEEVIAAPVISVPPVDIEPVIESMNRMNSSISQLHGTIKTMIVPVLVLILVIAIGILLKIK